MKTSSLHSHLPKRTDRRGLTLVELLAVISIMVMLVAVSIPVFKPMLESQRSAGAARVVAGALQRARVKAMQDHKTYGLEFVRFEEGNAPNVSIQLRLQRESKPFVAPEDLRVVVNNGTIHVCHWNSTDQKWNWDGVNTTDTANETLWKNNVKAGYKIQLGRQGRVYELDSAFRLKSPYNNLTLPDTDLSGTESTWAVEASVTRPPLPAFAPQVVLPKGSIVDLAFSGTSSKLFSGSAPVAVMFSGGGYVDCILAGTSLSEEKTNEIVYFCIGEWERQSLDSSGSTYAEDGRNNLLIPSNFWVTVNPRSGQVRITEFAAASQSKISDWQNAAAADKPGKLQDMIPDVRKFATENALNIGGF